jgi:hypothetical protein
MNRQGGGNLSFRDSLTKDELAAERPLYANGRRPLSVDPFLGMRLINEMGKEADKELLLNPILRTRDILEYADPGLLLNSQENKDYFDYDDEFLLVMSHPDTNSLCVRTISGRAVKMERPTSIYCPIGYLSLMTMSASRIQDLLKRFQV